MSIEIKKGRIPELFPVLMIKMCDLYVHLLNDEDTDKAYKIFNQSISDYMNSVGIPYDPDKCAIIFETEEEYALALLKWS